MICVSIGRGRHQMMIAEYKLLAEQGAELVELRLDYIRRPVNLSRILEGKPCPVVATVRRPRDGGKWMRSEEDRVMLLRSAIVSGVDYVDLEYDIAGSVPRYGKTQRIVSYHNFDETPSNLREIHKKMQKLDPDIIKIATKANNPIDNIRALRLCRDSSIPTVAFCMGEMGLISRVLCGRFGAPLTYATFNDDRQIAPGQLSFRQMQDDYRYDEITPNTKILGVIADPVEHSFSPSVHNACLRKLNLDMLYLPFRVPAEYLEEFVRCCPEMGIRGLSVTIPHKETILNSIGALDDNVAAIRAANTVVFDENIAYGYNTDCNAAVSCLIENLQLDPDSDLPLSQVRVCLLGAGGVARAIAFGLKRKGADVLICGRDTKKAEQFAKEMKCKPHPWEARQNHDCQVLVNCTPVGMHPNMDETPFDADWHDRSVTVFDTVYNPERTLLIKQAREANCPTITGIDMFSRQAAEQFRLFTQENPDEETIRFEVKRATSAAKY
ncbi:MAG: shikimate dehydrogenase [Planctomycetota bacterium]